MTRAVSSRAGTAGSAGWPSLGQAVRTKVPALEQWMTSSTSSRAGPRRAAARLRERNRRLRTCHERDPSSAFGTFSPLRRGEGSRCVHIASWSSSSRGCGIESLLPPASWGEKVAEGRMRGAMQPPKAGNFARKACPRLGQPAPPAVPARDDNACGEFGTASAQKEEILRQIRG